MLMILGLVSLSHAEMLSYTFDADTEGFSNLAWQAADPVGWSDVATVQMTHEAGAWQVPQIKEFGWVAGGGSANEQLAMQANANDPLAQISFDVMVDGGSFTPGAETWYQLIMIGNGDGAGWTQTQLTDDWHDVDDATLYTQHFDLSFADMGWTPGTTWFQIYMGSNSDGAVTSNYYLDNVVITPEPTTMALLGLGALVLRRRK